jgi:predicted regulator of Ras-like GTPase activity (Roadblock/LC7/MglB family)
VERGGVELLLTLYRLPRLPPTFGSTNASHSLLVSFRVFTSQHTAAQLPHIFGQLRTALLRQLEAALEAAKQVGGACVPLLPAEQRDNYIRHVSSTEGLAALASAVVRNASSVLKDISDGDMSVILRLGELERCVLWQAAVADEWKLEHEAKKAAEEKAAAAASAATERPPSAAGGGDQEMAEAAAGSAAAGSAASTAAGSAGAEPAEPAGAGGSSGGNGNGSGSKEKKKKTPEELACDILLHFAHTSRAFGQAVAKAIHVPVRRREEAAAAPTMAMKAAAVNLAVVLRRNFDFQGLEDPSDKGKAPATAASSQGVYSTNDARRVRYLQRVLDASFNVLFDGRRRTTHSLIYNYFLATGGMRAFLQQFGGCLELLRRLPPRPRQPSGDADMADAAGGAASGAAVGGSTGGGTVGGTAVEEAYRHSVEATVNTFLVLMTNMSHAPMVINSPNSANLITAPVPGAGDASKPAEDAPAFMRRVWGMLLASALPLWRDPQLLAAHGDKMVQSVVSVLRNCTENSSQLAAAVAASAAARTGARGSNADPTRVQQIVEMGFSQAQAEEALRRNGNHVELAMEWLFANPDAAAAAEASTAQQQPGPGDDEQLAAMVADALSAGGRRLGMLEEAQEEVPTATMPDTPALVDSAVKLLEAAPTAAFYASDLLKQHSAQSSKHRQGVLERLMWHLSSASNPTDAQLFAPAHLAAVLLAEVSPSREVAAEKGFASIALDAVDAWVSSHLPPLAAAAAPSGSPSKGARSAAAAGASGAGGSAPGAPPPVAVPRWVDTLLLALDILASTLPKPPPAPAPAGGAATSGDADARLAEITRATREARRLAEEQAQRLGIPVPDRPNRPASLEDMDRTIQEARRAGERYAQHLGLPLMGAAAGAPAAPSQPAADAAAPAAQEEATNVTATGQLQQAAAAVAGAAADRTASVTSPDNGAAGGDAPAAAGEGQAAGEELSAEERVWQALAAAVQQYSTGGSLSAQEQQRTVELCLRLLRHLGSWGAAWTPADLPPLPPEPESGSSPAAVAAAAAAAQARQREELTRPDPRSTLHAVVQLLARLSKDHALAEKVLAARGHAALLDLPPAVFKPELEPFVAAVFRHILEDPATLQV